MLSRRQMMAATTASLAMSAGARAKPILTANDIVERIKAHVGVPWQAKTVDGIVAGDPATPVSGIASVMMATFAELKEAAAAGLNFVVTHEPTFWSHQEEVASVKDNPLYRDKLAFIAEKKLVCFHFHDHWHALKPRDGIAEGMMRHLGWSGYVSAEDPQRFALPPTTLEALARHIQTRLHAKTIRVIGDPALAVKNVQASWGYAMKAAGIALLSRDVEVLIVGETWEWELQEYVADLAAMGRKKALIVVGHINSEQWGMEYCAEWLKGFVPEVPVRFLEMPEPYWGPR